MTALHANVSVGTEVLLRGKGGTTRSTTVVFSEFVLKIVDIAVLELDKDEPDFDYYIELAQNLVSVLDKITIIGLKPDEHDELGIYSAHCQVNFIQPSKDSTIFESDYTSTAGLSGAGIVTVVEHGQFHLVGVHVAAHDDTEEPPNKKNKKATVKMLSDDVDSLSNGLHGHRARTLICEALRAKHLVGFLNSKP